MNINLLTDKIIKGKIGFDLKGDTLAVSPNIVNIKSLNLSDKQSKYLTTFLKHPNDIQFIINVTSSDK